MVTIETIKAIPALEGLEKEQIEAVIQVVKDRVKDQNDRYDKDIERITGKAKPGDKHSYQHLENVLSEYVKTETAFKSLKESSESNASQLEALKAEKATLEEALKKGGDGAAVKALEQKLADKDNEINNLRTSFEEEKQTLSASLQAEKDRNVGFQFGQEIDKYLLENKVKFLQTIPEPIRNKHLADARKEVLSQSKLDVLEGNKMVFRDDNGEILWNKETGKHLTPGELYLSKIKDLIDQGQHQKGAGTKPGQSNGTQAVDLTGVKTKVEATDRITTYLLKVEGLAKTDPAFATKQAELYEAANLGDLPLR